MKKIRIEGAWRALCRAAFRCRFPWIAFGVTFCAMVVFALIRGIAPFGDNSLLTMDLWGQYYPMIVDHLREPFATWSWNGSLGFSALVQSAYYTNSLLNFLLLPFFGYAKIAALDLMIFLKAALASFFMAYYLEARSGKHTPLSAAFGVCYGLSAYMTAFLSQPMWLDAVLLLPLVLLGLENLLAGRRPYLYIAALSLTIYSNFYIGFMVCLFCVLWFFVRLFSDGKRRTLGTFAADTGKFALASLLSGGLCAFVLLPLYAGMQNWISTSLGFDTEISFYGKLSELLENLSVGEKPSLEYGAANIWCGSATLFFFLLFLLNRKIPWKKRLAKGLLLAFLFVSFDLNILDYIWHGLHFPNQLPARESFLFIFVLLVTAYEALTQIDGLHPITLSASLAVSAALLLVGIGDSQNKVGRIVSIGVILLSFAIVLGWLLTRERAARRFAAGLLAFLVTLESAFGAVYVMASYLGAASAVGYSVFDEEMKTLTEKYESGSDDFWRTEMIPNFTFDSGMLYGLRGETYYSSTMNGALYRFFESLGIRVYAQNVSTVYQSSPILDMMFGIRYLYTRENALPEGYGETVEKGTRISVVENPYTLPIAFGVSEKIKDYTASDKEPLEAQEALLQSAASVSTPIVREQYKALLSMENASTFRSGGKEYFSSDHPESNSTFSYQFTMDDAGEFYLYFHFVVGQYSVSVNEGAPTTGYVSSGKLKSLGTLSAGDTVSLTVTIKGYSVALYGVDGYIMDRDALANAHRKLSEYALDVESASKTSIKGTVTAAQDMVLYSSIPAENGWHVYLDGVEQETFALDGALLCTDLPAGTHTVEYVYRAPGLAAGIGISALSALLLIGVSLMFERRKKKKAEPDEPAS